MSDAPRLLTPQQVSERIGVAVETLANRRMTGQHSPPFVRIGARIYYDAADLDRWLANLPRQRSTREKVPR